MPTPLAKNLALWDRLLRALAAGVIVVLWLAGILPDLLALPLLALAGALLLNSLLGVCGLYAALGFSTCPAPKPPRGAAGEKKPR